MPPAHSEAHPFEPVRTGVDGFGPWLTIAEAVVFAEIEGLPRTAKTIRKWAARSYGNPEKAEVTVRREDTRNGHRYVIEKESLARKIAEELEFESRQLGTLVGTGAHLSEPVQDESSQQTIDEQDVHPSEPVTTGANGFESASTESTLLREQLEQARGEIEFLRGELQHRRETDKALGNVIEAFRQSAENTRDQLRLETEGRGDIARRSFGDVV